METQLHFPNPVGYLGSNQAAGAYVSLDPPESHHRYVATGR